MSERSELIPCIYIYIISEFFECNKNLLTCFLPSGQVVRSAKKATCTASVRGKS